MTDDHKKFAILMAMLGTAFGEKGIQSARIEIYWEHLKDIRLNDLERAVSFLIKNRKYSSIPTIAEIRETALGRDDEIETAALEAWGRATYAVERGAYPTSDIAVNEAVRVAFGGWEEFGKTAPEEGMADRAHFLRVYKSLARARRDRGLPALPRAQTAHLLEPVSTKEAR